MLMLLNNIIVYVTEIVMGIKKTTILRLYDSFESYNRKICMIQQEDK